MNANDKLKKESKINTGIYAIKIGIYSNLGKVDLNPKLFYFSEQSVPIKDLSDHPFLSINMKYNISKLDRMTHQECIYAFFNKRAFVNFLKMGIEPTNEDENSIIRSNIKIMLDYIFPMSFPVIRVVKKKSETVVLGFVKAFKKEFFKRKYNTILNINGKKCTVDGATMLDTFTTNPIYIKLSDSIENYKRLIPSAIQIEIKKLADLFGKVDDEIKKYSKKDSKDARDRRSDRSEYDESEKIKKNLNNIKAFKGFVDKLKEIVDKSNANDSYKEIKTQITQMKIQMDTVTNYERNPFIASFRSQFGICLTLMTVNYIGNYNQINRDYGVDLIGMNRKYAWHRKIIDDVQEFCFPKRESLNSDVKKAIEENGEFNLEEIQKKRDANIMVDVDKINLNIEKTGTPRYNITVQLSLFGGIITNENKKYIKCKYEEQKLGADINKQITDTEQGEYFDLSDEISKIDKKLAEANKKKKIVKNKNQEYNKNPENKNPENNNNKPENKYDMPAAKPQTNGKKLNNSAKQIIEDGIQSARQELSSTYSDSLYNNDDIISYIEDHDEFLDYANYAYTDDTNLSSDPNYDNNKRNKILKLNGNIETQIKVLKNQIDVFNKNPQDDELNKKKLEKEKSLLEIIRIIFKFNDKGSSPVNRRRTGGKKTRQLRRSRSLRRTRKLRKH